MENKTVAVKPDTLLRELETLVSEAKTLICDSDNDINDGAAETMRARFAEIQQRCSALYTKAQKKIVTGAKATDSAIRENPYQSLAIAVGLGLAVGVLLGRRSRQ